MTESKELMQIYEQMHVLSPLVQAREFYVLRYCQQIERGTWVIADVSCDYIGGHSHISPTCCWKHPSGFMIQELSNGLTKVNFSIIPLPMQFVVHISHTELLPDCIF